MSPFVRPTLIHAAAAVVVGFGALSAMPGALVAQAPTVFSLCYVPTVGALYRIKVASLPTACLDPSHVEFTWTDATQVIRIGDAAGGDLAGSYPNAMVVKVQGVPVSGTAPTNGQALVFDGTSWVPTPLPSGVTDHGALTGLADNDHPQYALVVSAVIDGDAAAGDLSGTYPNPTVARIQGTAVSATLPTNGQALVFDGTSWVPTPLPSGVTDHGALTGLEDNDHPQYALRAGAVMDGDAAGGDLTGTFPSPTVARIQGTPVAATPPTMGQTMVFDGTNWVPVTPQSGVTDHGLLAGLTDDDHVQYLLADGSRNTTNGFAVIGTLGTGTIPVTGSGVRMMWYPRKAAFRVGEAGGSQWDDVNVGNFSMAFGLNTTASGLYSVAMGENTNAKGEAATALGKNSTASGLNSTAMGVNTVASAENATAMGDNTDATAFAATAMGNSTTALGTNSTAMGLFTIASGPNSTAMGNQTTASGSSSTAMGVRTTASGAVSTAMGGLASTNFMNGAFVYGDQSTTNLLLAPAVNSFTVRAAGGVTFYTSSDLAAGVTLAAGAGSWASVSDRARKANFRDEDGERALARIAAMPIQSWNYLAEDPSIRHIGPTAQDFYGAFGLGTDDRTIHTIDIDGINLLAVQALESRTRDLAARLAAVTAENDSLRARLAALEALVQQVVGARE